MLASTMWHQHIWYASEVACCSGAGSRQPGTEHAGVALRALASTGRLGSGAATLLIVIGARRAHAARAHRRRCRSSFGAAARRRAGGRPATRRRRRWRRPSAASAAPSPARCRSTGSMTARREGSGINAQDQGHRLRLLQPSRRTYRLLSGVTDHTENHCQGLLAGGKAPDSPVGA